MPLKLSGEDGRSVSLRPAAAADLAQLRRLLVDLELTTAGVTEWWPHFMVADVDGEIVGAAGIETYAEGTLLRSVAVRPAWRGAGIGRALVAAALDMASQAGARDVYLLTTTAEGYFPRLGFAAIPRASVPGSVQESVQFRETCPSGAIVMHRLVDRAPQHPAP